jgi:hypothetical protein
VDVTIGLNNEDTPLSAQVFVYTVLYFEKSEAVTMIRNLSVI